MSSRVLVLTTVHHPLDARIWQRQVAALLRAGWSVTYGAPFSARKVDPPKAKNLECIDLPRAVGRRRLRALRSARSTMRRLSPSHDLVLIHDIELLVVTGKIRNLVWDVHEDTAAALIAKPWIPQPLRRISRHLIHQLERWAERRHCIILAEYRYQERFSRNHAVVPNTVEVPEQVSPPQQPNVTYLGTVTMERGAKELAEVGRLLRDRTGGKISLRVIGSAHGEARGLISAASKAGYLEWRGFLPSDQALAMLPGSLAGLSLLHDLPNYRHSMPTKLIEYMAHGVPVITTPLPLAVDLVDRAGGIVIPFLDVERAVSEIMRLYEHPDYAKNLAERAFQVAREKYDWNISQGYFISSLEACIPSS